MKTITLSKSGCQKLTRSEFRLKKEDILDLPKSFIPGEWIQCLNESNKDCYLGFINLSTQDPWSPIHIVQKLERPYSATDNEEDIGRHWVKNLLMESIQRRKSFQGYAEQGRMVYGEIDGLPGLIVDQYENCVLIQISTAGIDRFRDMVKSYFQQSISEKKIIIFDNAENRLIEGLPAYENREDINLVHLKENNFKLSIPFKKVQKVGYYYDHRLNRLRFEKLISQSCMEFKNGLDLFCYIGSWGLHQLRGGVKEVTLVDQGNFGEEIRTNMEQNDFGDRGKFQRQDVFKYLDDLIARNESFDVISSDPPAFTKNAKGKINALNGYLKLHQKIMKLINKNGLLAVNSCTKYVDFFELDQSVQMAARKEGRKLLLVDIGLQGIDHPMRSLKDNSHYLKYLAYIMEA